MVYTHNGILFSHKKEILSLATTWVNSEDISLKRTKKDCIERFHLFKVSKVVKVMRAGSKMVLPCVEGGANGDRYRNRVMQDKNISRELMCSNMLIAINTILY